MAEIVHLWWCWLYPSRYILDFGDKCRWRGKIIDSSRGLLGRRWGTHLMGLLRRGLLVVTGHWRLMTKSNTLGHLGMMILLGIRLGRVLLGMIVLLKIKLYYTTLHLVQKSLIHELFSPSFTCYFEKRRGYLIRVII